MEHKCNSHPSVCSRHPDAPHGFLRNESHSQDRYVCECEYWTPPQVDLLQQAIDMLDGTYQAHAVRKLLQDYQILSEQDAINWYGKGWDDAKRDSWEEQN